MQAVPPVICTSTVDHMQGNKHGSKHDHFGKRDTDHPIVDRLRSALRAGSFHFWCLCFFGGGIAGVCVDLDHVPLYFFNILLSTPVNIFHFGPGRSLHPALFLIGCCVFACAGGLLLLMVLADGYRTYQITRHKPVTRTPGSAASRPVAKKSKKARPVVSTGRRE